VLFPTERQAPLSPAAVKASAGATEHLLLCPVDDLAGAMTDLHVRGVRVVGSDSEAPLTARQADLRGPLAIVVGSEGHGLSPTVRRRCDLMVRIPMRGAIGSLNAAVAGSVLLFEALGQRDPEARPARPPETAARPAPTPKRSRVTRRTSPDEASIEASTEAPTDASRGEPASPEPVTDEPVALEVAAPEPEITEPAAPEAATLEVPPAPDAAPDAEGVATAGAPVLPEPVLSQAVLPDEPPAPRRRRRPTGAA
jgi:tRNA(Leu) C34 or U34 (ribose-2'-O)-methylase TrmL